MKHLVEKRAKVQEDKESRIKEFKVEDQNIDVNIHISIEEKRYITFRNCIFLGDVKLGDGFVTNLKLDEAVKNNDYNPSIKFENCTFKKTVYFSILKNFNRIEFFNCHIRKADFSIFFESPKLVNLWSCGINSLTLFHCSIENHVSFRLLYLDYICMNFVDVYGKFTLTSDNNVRIIYINELNNMGKINLSQLCSRIGLNKRVMDLSPSTTHIPISSRCNIYNSSFGNCNLSNCHFNEYAFFYFFNNDISDLSISNVKFRKGKLNLLPSETLKEYRIDNLEYFLKIKTLMNNNGDLDYYKFHSLYSDQLIPFAKKSEKPLLILGKLISSHCTNWYLPLIYIITLNLIFYISINNLLDIKGSLSDISVLLNPLHLTSHFSFYEKGKIFNQLFYTVDIISRAVNSTLYYHLIKAFRKFT